MNRFSVAVLTPALGFTMLLAHAQTPSPSADPYANNPDAGKGDGFPLAAPPGKDSGAISTAPPGAVNQGPLRSGQVEVWPGI